MVETWFSFWLLYQMRSFTSRLQYLVCSLCGLLLKSSGTKMQATIWHLINNIWTFNATWTTASTIWYFQCVCCYNHYINFLWQHFCHIVRVFHVVVKKPSLVLFCVVLWVLFSVCASKNRKPLAYSACYNVVCFYGQQRVQKKL